MRPCVDVDRHRRTHAGCAAQSWFPGREFEGVGAKNPIGQQDEGQDRD